MVEVIRDFPRPTPDQLAGWDGIGAATAHEAQGRRGAVDSAIKPIYPGLRVFGPALTCVCPPGDNLTLHAAIKLAKPGDVIVCDAGDYPEQGLFGDVMASSALGRGIAGLVTNGGVRDAATIRDLGFPVFSRSISIKGTIKETLGPVNRPVVLGGILVRPGDLVIGDDDGVAIVPLEEIEAVRAASRQREEKEATFRSKLATGVTTWDLGGYGAILRRKGIELDL